MTKPHLVEATIEAPVKAKKTAPKKKAMSTEPKLAPKDSPRTHLRQKLQRSAGLLLAGVASAMTGVSLAHTAGGTEFLTSGAIPEWQCWGVAIGLDINYIGMEFAGVVAATQVVRDRLHRFTKFGIPAVMIFSMAMNALEFARGASDPYKMAAGIIVGIALPLLIWLAFKVSAILADI